jgi:hypothetical protein
MHNSLFVTNLTPVRHPIEFRVKPKKPSTSSSIDKAAKL